MQLQEYTIHVEGTWGTQGFSTPELEIDFQILLRISIHLSVHRILQLVLLLVGLPKLLEPIIFQKILHGFFKYQTS